MTDATLHHVPEPILTPGTYFLCGGPMGTSSASMTHLRQAGHWEHTSRRLSPIAAKHTPCCEVASVFRRDVLMMHTGWLFVFQMPTQIIHQFHVCLQRLHPNIKCQ